MVDCAYVYVCVYVYTCVYVYQIDMLVNVSSVTPTISPHPIVTVQTSHCYASERSVR